ncbi:MAG: hypothetical protein ACYTAO_02170 [Planctomycetota bacterium]
MIPRMPTPPEYKNGAGLGEHPDYPHDHPSWPKKCSCGRDFGSDDHWQVNVNVLYVARGTKEAAGYDGQLFVIQEAPVGAMWDAWWYKDNFKGADGKCIVLKTPGGDWIVDGTSSDGGKWQRSGEPPELTVNPSIGIGREPGKPWTYHGWLRDGYLVEC